MFEPFASELNRKQLKIAAKMTATFLMAIVHFFPRTAVRCRIQESFRHVIAACTRDN